MGINIHRKTCNRTLCTTLVGISFQNINWLDNSDNEISINTWNWPSFAYILLAILAWTNWVNSCKIIWNLLNYKLEIFPIFVFDTIRHEQTLVFTADIFLKIIWNKFHWSLFLAVKLRISQHWLGQWLGAIQVPNHCLNQYIIASLGDKY